MIRVIPAIDLIEGKCVRLTHGEFSRRKIYESDPLEVATAYAEAGFRDLHVVDLDGARKGRVIQLEMLSRLVQESGMRVQFGGGVQSNRDLGAALDAGASRVLVGSAAAEKPQLVKSWIQEFGPECIVIAADSLDGRIRVDAWRRESALDVVEMLDRLRKAGASQALCTDVARDGAMMGPSFELYGRIKSKLPELELIASGGIRSREDLMDLDALGVEAAVVGKALLDGTLALDELEDFAC